MRPNGRGRGIPVLAAMVLLAGVAACGGDDPVDVDLLDAEAVVGKYDYGTLAFDIAGPTFGSYDLLQRLSLEPATHFLVIVADGTAQLVFEHPTNGTLQPANGTYRMLRDGVRIQFRNAGQPGVLLIPQVFDLAYDEATGELSYIDEVSVPLSRLETLAPELAEEPLTDPVPGTLTVVFEPRREE